MFGCGSPTGGLSIHRQGIYNRATRRRSVSGPIVRVALAVAGIALLLGGGLAVDAGVDGLGTCGETRLVAERVEAVEEPERYVAFGNLTASQQALAERAIAGESPAVEYETWPWLESALYLTYEGDSYSLYTVTSECPFPPAGIVAVGVVAAALGLGTLAVLLRRLRSASNDR
jgi:hypothetical protein